MAQSAFAKEDLDTEFDVIETYLPVVLHTQLKSIQLWSFIGFWPTTLFGIISGNWKPATKAMVWGTRLSILSATGLLIYKTSSLTNQEIFDRSYRIKHNYPQLELDRYSIVGGTIGLLPAIAGLRGGVTAGIALGTSAWLAKAVYHRYSKSEKKN